MCGSARPGTARRCTLKKEGKPVSYQAPVEGAIVWLDGVSLMKSAKNVDQVYEFINYLHTPEVSAQVSDGLELQPGRDRRRRADLGRVQEELPGGLSGRCAGSRLAVAGGAELVCRDPQPICGSVHRRLIWPERQRRQPRFAGADAFLGQCLDSRRGLSLERGGLDPA